MTDKTAQVVRDLFKAGAIDVAKLRKTQHMLTPWQSLTIKDFRDKAWVGKMTRAQILGPSTQAISSGKRDSDIVELMLLVDSKILEHNDTATSEGHTRYWLTPFGIALGLLMFDTGLDLGGNSVSLKKFDYSGMTKAQILSTIPEPFEGRVLPPKHILVLFGEIEIENERPDDEELLDAVRDANSLMESGVDLGEEE